MYLVTIMKTVDQIKISTERIDGAVATIMALSRAVCQLENTSSIYDEIGRLVL